eukprot:364386-Chlamydomonas_euryale.AAC.5
MRCRSRHAGSSSSSSSPPPSSRSGACSASSFSRPCRRGVEVCVRRCARRAARGRWGHAFEGGVIHPPS